jgi:predicted O-methyltransferase YrrM
MVQAQITKTDFEVLMKVIQSEDIKNILEIGTHMGGSADLLIRNFLPEKFVTVEKEEENHFNEVLVHDKYNYLWGHDSTDQKTIQKVKELMPEVDLLFIDGNHEYKYVRWDFENYSPLVRNGGIILFHDVFPIHYFIQVKTFWEELKQKYNYLEIKTDFYSTGIGVIWQNKTIAVGQS